MTKKEKFLHIRVDKDQRERWLDISRVLDLPLSQWVRQTLDAALSAVTEEKNV